MLVTEIGVFLEQANLPRFTGENIEKNKILYTRLSDLAIKHACTVPQLALAWLLHQGDDIIPIPGMLGSFFNFPQTMSSYSYGFDSKPLLPSDGSGHLLVQSMNYIDTVKMKCFFLIALHVF